MKGSIDRKMIWLNEFALVEVDVLLAQGGRLHGESQQDENVGLGVDGADELLLLARSAVVPTRGSHVA